MELRFALAIIIQTPPTPRIPNTTRATMQGMSHLELLDVVVGARFVVGADDCGAAVRGI